MVEIQIEKVQFPNEDVLQYIETSRRISIARDAYASREYYNPWHREGKNIPVYRANKGKGDGEHILLVDIAGINYVVLPVGKAQKDPIKRFKSGRNND